MSFRYVLNSAACILYAYALDALSSSIEDGMVVKFFVIQNRFDVEFPHHRAGTIFLTYSLPSFTPALTRSSNLPSFLLLI